MFSDRKPLTHGLLKLLPSVAAFAAALLFTASSQALAQEEDPAPSDSTIAADTTAGADSSGVDDTARRFLEGFRLYGSLRVQGVTYSGTTEIQGNASRIGFRLTRDFFDSGLQVFGQVELGLNLIENFADFNVSSSQSGFGRLIPGARSDAVFVRLGFIGFDFGDFGILSAGKQWSTYYDVAGYTDNFFVFGGRASGAYNLGSDGGASGTGRADKSLSYRNQIGNFGFGLQAQLEANKETGLGSVGGSAQYEFPFGLRLGIAGNYSDLPDVISEQILGAGERAWAVVVGARVERPRWFLAANYSIQKSHDARDTDSITVAYDASGFELFGYFDVSRRFRVSGGFNDLEPDANDPVADDFRVRFGVLGGAYYLNSQTLVYTEWKFGDTRDQFGEKESNVLALGVRLDFGLPEMQRNDAPPLRFPESNLE